MNTVVITRMYDRPLTVELTGRKVYLVRCVVPEQGNIVMPDVLADRTPWYEIRGVSKDCRSFGSADVGKKIILSDNATIGNVWMVGPAQRIAREDWLLKHSLMIVSE